MKLIRYLKKFLYVFAGRQRQLVFLLLIFITTSVLEAFGIGMLGPFINLAANPELVQNNSTLSRVYEFFNFQSYSLFIVALGLFVVSIFIIKSTMFLLSKAYTYKVLLSQRSAIRTRLLNAYLYAPYEFHLTRNSADFVNKIIVEANRFTNLVALPLVEVCSQVVVIVALVALMASTDILLVLISLGTLLPAFLGFLLIGKRLKEWGRGASRAREKTLRVVSHGLGGLKETYVIGCESYFQKEMMRHVEAEASLESRFQTAQVVPRTLIEALLMVAIVGFICLSQFFLQQDFNSVVSTMGIFAVASFRLVPAGSQLMQSFGRIRNSAYTLDCLYLDLKEVEGQSPIYQKENRSSAKPLSFHQDLELKDVVYRYPNSTPASLDGISLCIKRGESIGLIGPSGSGKTTLVDVILGLLQPESGDICLDGTSIYSNLSSWKKLIGYIPQSIFLLDDTIERNIAFGVPDLEIDSDRLWHAIKAAQLDELVQSLPEGLKTTTGERGVRLSGGQRQRIGIARALYHQREILILDEATSALDSQTEQLISHSIDALAGAKTLIIIAHRLSTLEHCDRVYALEKGKVTKQGSYETVVLST